MLGLKRKWQQLKSIRTKQDVLVFFEDIEEPFKKLFSSVEIESWWKNFALSIPRVFFGILLLSDYWRVKIGMPVNEIEALLPEDLTLPSWLNWIDEETLIWFERIEYWFQGGMMITGFNTRLITFSFVWVILNRLFSVENFELWSLSLTILFMLVSIYSMILGSGKLGLDYLISTKFSKKNR